jgi:hypothetical protein
MIKGDGIYTGVKGWHIYMSVDFLPCIYSKSSEVVQMQADKHYASFSCIDTHL